MTPAESALSAAPRTSVRSDGGRCRGASPGTLSLVGMLLGAILLAALLPGCGQATTSGTTADAPTAPTVVVPPAATDLQQTVVNVIRAVQPSVVEIQSSGGQGGAIGSGEVYRTDGYITTNDHVVRGYTTTPSSWPTGAACPRAWWGRRPATTWRW